MIVLKFLFSPLAFILQVPRWSLGAAEANASLVEACSTAQPVSSAAGSAGSVPVVASETAGRAEQSSGKPPVPGGFCW